MHVPGAIGKVDALSRQSFAHRPRDMRRHEDYGNPLVLLHRENLVRDGTLPTLDRSLNLHCEAVPTRVQDEIDLAVWLETVERT
jgi:hypothetical protein